MTRPLGPTAPAGAAIIRRGFFNNHKEYQVTDTETTKAPRVQTEIDIATQTLTVEGERYTLADLPAPVVQYLALLGLRTRLIQVDDRAKAFADLRAGTLPMRKAAAEKISPWDQAIAAALVEATKRTPSPILAPAAAEAVRGMSKEQRQAAKRDPAVVKHHQRITGVKTSLLDIVQGAAPAEAREEAAA